MQKRHKLLDRRAEFEILLAFLSIERFGMEEIMSKINDTTAVKQQYATANNLNTRISIHDKYSTNKMGFGNWIVSNYEIEKGDKVLELGCGNGDMWKNRESLIGCH